MNIAGKPLWVVFDIGGVIFDYNKPFQKIAKILNTEKETLQQKLFSYLADGEIGNIEFETAWQEILIDLEKTHQPKEIIEIWEDTQWFVKDTRLLIQQLHQRGYKICFFSNTWNNIIQRHLSKLEEFSLFSIGIDSSQEKIRKPDNKIYQKVEEKLQASGSQIYFIDDNKHNIETAKSFNWRVLLYTLGEDDGRTTNNQIRKDLL